MGWRARTKCSGGCWADGFQATLGNQLVGGRRSRERRPNHLVAATRSSAARRRPPGSNPSLARWDRATSWFKLHASELGSANLLVQNQALPPRDRQPPGSNSPIRRLERQPLGSAPRSSSRIPQPIGSDPRSPSPDRQPIGSSSGVGRPEPQPVGSQARSSSRRSRTRRLAVAVRRSTPRADRLAWGRPRVAGASHRPHPPSSSMIPLTRSWSRCLPGISSKYRR